MKKFSLFSMTVMLFAVAACVRMPNPGGGVGGGGETDMRFTVTIPGENPSPASTRAPSHSDIDIENISVFVFNGGPNPSGNVFIERREATDIELQSGYNAATGAASYSFTVRLSLSTSLRNVYFVANAKDSDGYDRFEYTGDEPEIDLSGKTEAQVWGYHNTNEPGLMRTKALSSPAAEADMLPLMMWGKLWISQVVSTQAVQNVKLLRTAAAIDVRKDQGVTDFTIHRVSAGNIAASVPVPPASVWTWDNNSAQTPTDNTIPEAAASVNQFGTNYSTGYWTEWSSAAGSANLHYINETAAADEPYILVDATYDGTRGYYKLQLKSPATGDPLDLRRNHKYIVNIVAVSGQGYTTVAEAVNGEYSNEELTTHVDEFDDLISFVADGHNYIGISNDEAYMAHLNGATFEIAKVFSSSGVYNFVNNDDNSITNLALSGGGNVALTLSAPDPATGMRTINGTVSGTTQGTGYFKISNGSGLSVNINVLVTITNDGWNPSMGGGANWVHDQGVTIPTHNGPWSVELLDVPNYKNILMQVGTNAPSTQPGNNMGTSITSFPPPWGITYYEGNGTSAHIYLLVPKNSPDYYGKIKYTYLNDEGQFSVIYCILED